MSTVKIRCLRPFYLNATTTVAVGEVVDVSHLVALDIIRGARGVIVHPEAMADLQATADRENLRHAAENRAQARKLMS